MPDLTAAALDVLLRQLGVISRVQLRAAGVGDRARQRLLRDRVLEPVGRSVYRIGGHVPTFESRLIELCLEHPAGFITGPTLGAYHNLRRMPRTSGIHLCVPHPARIDHPNFVELRQSTLILPEHVVRLPNGMNVASWPRLAFDLASDLRTDNLASVIEQMLHRKAVTIPELGRIGRQLCRRGRPGSATFAEVLLEHHAGPAAESHPELRVLKGLRRRGIPVEPQVSNLPLPDGRMVRLDMAVSALRWGVEVDVHPAHLHLRGTTGDKRRDRQLHLIDWQIERVTPIDLIDLEGLLDELASLAHQRALHLGRRVAP
jgi:hypothetical protein